MIANISTESTAQDFAQDVKNLVQLVQLSTGNNLNIKKIPILAKQKPLTYII